MYEALVSKDYPRACLTFKNHIDKRWNLAIIVEQYKKSISKPNKHLDSLLNGSEHDKDAIQKALIFQNH